MITPVAFSRSTALLPFALGLAFSAAAGAATITGSLGTPVTGAPQLISTTEVADWAYFGHGVDSLPTTIDRADNGPASFSAISGGALIGGDSRMQLQFTGGAPTTGAISTQFVFPNQADGASLSFTASILAPEQTISIYLVGYNSRADISVTIGSETFSLADAILPYTNDGDGSGSGHTAGLLTLNIGDAVVGDTLTFTVSNEYDGVTDSSYGFIGIQAATVTIVPEPSSMILGGLGLCGLVLRRRVRR